MNLNVIIGAVLAILIVLISIFFIIPIISKSLEPAKPISVEVTLNNKCTVTDDAFMIITNPNNLKAYFNNGKARLRIMSN